MIFIQCNYKISYFGIKKKEKIKFPFYVWVVSNYHKNAPSRTFNDITRR